MSQIIRHNINTLWQLWELRNLKVHNVQSKKTHLQVVSEINKLFQEPCHHWPQSVQHLFRDQEKLLSWLLPNLQQWLTAAQVYCDTNPQLLDRPLHGIRLLRSI